MWAVAWEGPCGKSHCSAVHTSRVRAWWLCGDAAAAAARQAAKQKLHPISLTLAPQAAVSESQGSVTFSLGRCGQAQAASVTYSCHPNGSLDQRSACTCAGRGASGCAYAVLHRCLPVQRSTLPSDGQSTLHCLMVQCMLLHVTLHQHGFQAGGCMTPDRCFGPLERTTHLPYPARLPGLNNNSYQISRGLHHNSRAGHGISQTCSYVKADFMKMPFEDGSFDAVYEIDATCHAPDQVLSCVLVRVSACVRVRRA